jgi:hypothetical protein
MERRAALENRPQQLFIWRYSIPLTDLNIQERSVVLL